VRFDAAAIIIITLVLAGALLIRLLAPDECATFGDALWFTLQMVTTVGFGDNTPTSGVGRFVASVVMLVPIGPPTRDHRVARPDRRRTTSQLGEPRSDRSEPLEPAMALPVGHHSVERLDLDSGVVHIVIDDAVTEASARQCRLLE